eukprot:GEZU01011265.1.p1 GENE.GEZU01011265.1~~GEZU01011265.1.p1  ORF type:complete len:236 (-),score=62.91 GEZU01011265.1:101-808(-)
MNSPCCVFFDTEKQITIKRNLIAGGGSMSPMGKDTMKTFSFDRVFDMNATQEMVYSSTAKVVLQKVVQGFNGCVFAYGQTGSGKTFTMEGTPSNPGTIPLLCTELFEYIEAHVHDTEFSVKASYLEIYQENLKDLLDKNSSANKKLTAELKIREDKLNGISVTNINRVSVGSYEDVLKVISEGAKQRSVGETNMNAVSSRSHAVFTLYIEQKEKNDIDGFSLKHSKLHLIDLVAY